MVVMMVVAMVGLWAVEMVHERVDCSVVETVVLMVGSSVVD